ncbi:MAG TPA: hypothetical protein VJP58_01040 [Candidatus Nitrosocosmicus sp.]|nr:hypothetical protein [Candidatus Nitrosocosmicus sp.]
MPEGANASNVLESFLGNNSTQISNDLRVALVFIAATFLFITSVLHPSISLSKFIYTNLSILSMF